MHQNKKNNIILPAIIILVIVLIVGLIIYFDYSSNNQVQEDVATNNNVNEASSEFVVLHKDENKALDALNVRLQLLEVSLPQCPDENKDSLCYRQGVKAEVLVGSLDGKEVQKVELNGLNAIESQPEVSLRLVAAERNLVRLIVLKNK